MKIFFTGSPRALKDYKKEHELIYKYIKDLGHTHLSALVVKADPDDFYQRDHDKVIDHYGKTIKDLKDADVVIAEVTTHSMSMGFLVNKALEMNKPVVVFHLKGKPPFFFSGIENDKLQIVEYTLDNLEEVLTNALEFARDQSDIRFNFFISPSIASYLDHIAKGSRIPRSVYLRRLIEADMKTNEEYKKAA